MSPVNQTASQNAEEFGFEPGDIVQEWLWDDDVDDSIRAQIEELTGEDLVDEDYDSAVDGVIVWWRDGDDEDELSDTIVARAADKPQSIRLTLSVLTGVVCCVVLLGVTECHCD